jgi:cytochrome c553
MNKRSLLLTAATVGIAALFAATLIHAGTEVKEIIKLEDPAYKKHKKGVVHFEHKKHQDDYAQKYPEYYKNKCGECHHDKDNKPLSGLKEGDNVQKCIECHKIAAEMPKKDIKAMRAKKVSKKEIKSKKLEYHAEAYHYNCRGCHRLYNKKYKPQKEKKAPTTCVTCHPKAKK